MAQITFRVRNTDFRVCIAMGHGPLGDEYGNCNTRTDRKKGVACNECS